jgi:hypothetical protein
MSLVIGTGLGSNETGEKRLVTKGMLTEEMGVFENARPL